MDIDQLILKLTRSIEANTDVLAKMSGVPNPQGGGIGKAPSLPGGYAGSSFSDPTRHLPFTPIPGNQAPQAGGFTTSAASKIGEAIAREFSIQMKRLEGGGVHPGGSPAPATSSIGMLQKYLSNPAAITGPTPGGSPFRNAQANPQAILALGQTSPIAGLRPPPISPPEPHPFSLMTNRNPDNFKTQAQVFKEQQNRNYENAGTASQLGIHGPASTLVNMSMLGQGLQGAGFTKAGAMVSRYAPHIAIAKAGVDLGASVADAAYNPYISDAQVGRSVFRSLPGGEWAQSTIDRFSGRSQGMAAAGREGEIGQNRAAIGHQIALYDMQERGAQVRREQTAVGARELVGDDRMYLPAGINRTTAAGELEFRQQSRLLPGKQQMARAEKELAVAKREEANATHYLNERNAKMLEIDKQLIPLREKTQNPQRAGSGEDLQRDLMRRSELETMRENVVEEIKTVTERQRQAKVEVGQAQGGVALASAADLRNQAANAQEQAEITTGGAKRLGHMNPLERIQAKQAFELQTKYGAENLPEQINNLAESFAPRTVEKRLEIRGAKTPEFTFGQTNAPEDFGKPGTTPEAARQNAMNLERATVGAQLEGEARMAQAAADAGVGMADKMVELMKIIERSFGNRLDTRGRIQQNQP